MSDVPDLIDFPCSDLWLDHYHRLGLTPRKSPNYYASMDESDMWGKIRTLENATGELREQLRHLSRRTPGPRPPERQPPPTHTPPAKPNVRGIDI